MSCRSLSLGLIAVFAIPATASAGTLDDLRNPANDGTIAVMGGSAGGTSTTLISELAKVLHEPHDFRILPIVGNGAKQSLEDVAILHDVPMAVVQSDLLQYFEKEVDPKIHDDIQCLMAMQREEMHVIARREIGSVEDLDGRNVNIGPSSSGGSVTSARMLDELGIDANISTYSHGIALEMLKEGKIDAMTRVGGAPHKKIAAIENPDLHFLPVSAADVGAPYIEASLDPGDYPIADGPVETFAVQAALVVSTDLSQTQKVMVDRLAQRLPAAVQVLSSGDYHPKWASIDAGSSINGCASYQ